MNDFSSEVWQILERSEANVIDLIVGAVGAAEVSGVSVLDPFRHSLDLSRK